LKVQFRHKSVLKTQYNQITQLQVTKIEEPALRGRGAGGPSLLLRRRGPP